MDPITPQEDRSERDAGVGSSVTVEELRYQFEGLRGLFLFALVALIALTVTADLCFLRKQMVFVRAQLEDQQPKVSEKVTTYNKSTAPLVKSFTASLQMFASTNADFKPILDKYRPILWPYMVPAVAPGSPAPAAKP